MVVEMTSLQGEVGRQYALADGEPQAVAEAIFEHYLPRNAWDLMPTQDPGAIVGDLGRGEEEEHCYKQALEIALEAGMRERVALLWEICQVPDFRKLMTDAHVRLLAQLFAALRLHERQAVAASSPGLGTGLLGLGQGGAERAVAELDALGVQMRLAVPGEL